MMVIGAPTDSTYSMNDPQRMPLALATDSHGRQTQTGVYWTQNQRTLAAFTGDVM